MWKTSTYVHLATKPITLFDDTKIGTHPLSNTARLQTQSVHNLSETEVKEKEAALSTLQSSIDGLVHYTTRHDEPFCQNMLVF